MEIKSLMVTLVVSYMAITCAIAAPDITIQREPHYNALPSADSVNKRIYVIFDGSLKMTRILQAKLRSRGYSIVETPDDAEEQYRFGGIFMLSGAGKEEARGKLGDMLESAVMDDLGKSPNYTHKNIDLLQIGVSAAYSGIASAISITDIARWLSQKTGVSGRFNELLTGDPRGFCLADSCSKYTNTVIMNVKGSSGHWWIQEKAQDSRVVLDIVVADTMENILKPFYDLRPPMPSMMEGNNQ